MNLLFAAATEILKFETAVLLIVVAGLLVLAKIVSDLRTEVRVLRKAIVPSKPDQTAQPAPVAPAVLPTASPVPAPSDEIPADIYAAIVSAIHFTLGDSHQILSVSPVESLAWSREGRRSIFRSHTFR